MNHNIEDVDDHKPHGNGQVLELDAQSRRDISSDDVEFDQLCPEVDHFSASISTTQADIPKHVDHFLKNMESKLQCYETEYSSTTTTKFGHSVDDVFMFLSTVDRLVKLVKSASKIKSNSTCAVVGFLNHASSLLHRAMVILEDEAFVILEQYKGGLSKSYSLDPTPHKSMISVRRRLQSFKSSNQRHQDHYYSNNNNIINNNDNNNQEMDSEEDTFPSYTSEDISMMTLISRTMILAGYKTECVNIFEMTRRNAFEEDLRSQGFDKISIDEMMRMQWEALEGDVATWIRVLKRCSSHLFPSELKFYRSIFSSQAYRSDSHLPIWRLLYNNHANNVIHQLLSFALAVSLTSKSSEKLFKFLDMYETLRDLASWIDDSTPPLTVESMGDLKFEIEKARSELGLAIVSIFSELENSIKSDFDAKQPIPGGAIHPLIRYTMNYLRYACEYKDTLEEVFQCYQRSSSKSFEQDQTNYKNHGSQRKPFASQLLTIVDLLEENVDAKSKLYKDTSLRCIFLMNNGRYMLQKIRGSMEILQAIGDTWYKKRSSEMKSYHKRYQRDTWGKVLQSISPAGLQVNGKVQKPILKERFKNFNTVFDEIQRTQSTWMVSDEQLRSELRVSISAVMIPAYRAFLARFGHVFTPGRQYEKHIKYQPDDIEAGIDELFNGAPNSLARRRT